MLQLFIRPSKGISTNASAASFSAGSSPGVPSMMLAMRMQRQAASAHAAPKHASAQPLEPLMIFFGVGVRGEVLEGTFKCFLEASRLLTKIKGPEALTVLVRLENIFDDASKSERKNL